MSVAERLAAAIGPDRVLTDPGDLHFYSMDIYAAGSTPAAVVLPRSTEELQEAIRAIAGSGAVIVPRGGGVSYTGGVVPPTTEAVVVDTSAMDRIVEVNAEDMYVTIEAGCTWAALRDRLEPEGIRTPFWGPLSGAYATVGGSVSQGAVLWGSTRFGTSAESVLGLEVVLADGSLLRTGTGAISDSRPGFRNFGPDLTGPFLGDSGALGIKATVTLRLVEAPAETGFASYEFEHRNDLIHALSGLSRSGTVVSGFALDPVLTDHRIRRGSVAQGAGAAVSMIGSASNKLRAIRDAARMAAKGRGFVGSDTYTLHLVTEGPTRAAVEADLERIARICSRGRVLDDTIPKLLNARPFGSLTSALGPEGQRWAPLHVLVPHSKAREVWDAADEIISRHREAMQAHEVEAGSMISAVSTTSLLIEFVMTWPGPRTAFYERKIEPGKLRRYPDHERSPEAEALVGAMRDEMVAMFAARGGAHFQIGRRYSYIDRLEPNTRRILETLKAAVDPNGIMNPGVLGLTRPHSANVTPLD